MSMFEARYYDGKTSQQHKVTVYPASATEMRIVGDTVDVVCALAHVRVSPRVGNTRRHLYFVDGAQCETEDNDAVDVLFKRHPAVALNHPLHHWESKLRYVGLALVLTVAIIWLGITYGVPSLAKQVAFHLPVATDELIGKEALAELDQHFLHPSRLSPVRQAELSQHFADLQRDIPHAQRYQLVLRDSPSIGANALALPSGIIVMTDALVKLAQNEDELVGVLAHEIGHLQQRHAVRQLLQNSATALVVMVITGDIGTVTSLAAGLPTLLVQSKYSRDFEREADDFAFAYLKQHHRSPEALTGILLRMEKRGSESASIWDVFSTHPATQERAERAKGMR